MNLFTKLYVHIIIHDGMFLNTHGLFNVKYSKLKDYLEVLCFHPLKELCDIKPLKMFIEQTLKFQNSLI